MDTHITIASYMATYSYIYVYVCVCVCVCVQAQRKVVNSGGAKQPTKIFFYGKKLNPMEYSLNKGGL